jgi:hypothetical protein
VYPAEVKKDYATDLSAAPDHLPFNGHYPTYEMEANGKPFRHALELRTATPSVYLNRTLTDEAPLVTRDWPGVSSLQQIMRQWGVRMLKFRGGPNEPTEFHVDFYSSVVRHLNFLRSTGFFPHSSPII